MRALDVAVGRGRYALLLASAGFDTFGVDQNVDALREAMVEAGRWHLQLRLWAADLELRQLPTSRFDLLVCAKYLQRNLFGAIREAVKPGGVVVYETFTTYQFQHGTGPRSPDHLLRQGELRELFSDWSVLEYEETERPEAVASLVARKPAS